MQAIHKDMASGPQFLSAGMPTIRLSGISTLISNKPAPLHRRKNSDELDVFEATRYFSGSSNDIDFLINRASPDRLMGEESYLPHTEPPKIEKPVTKQKQTTSSGARLANFITSLFHHAITSRRKSKPAAANTTPSAQDKEIHGRWNKRSSRVSTTQSTNIRSSDFRSTNSCGGSGFWTPPLYPDTAVVMLEEMSGCPQRKYCCHPKSASFCASSDVWEHRRTIEVPWLPEKAEFSVGAWTDRIKWVVNECSDVVLKRDGAWLSGRKSSSRCTDELEDDDVDVQSDCSSDLFELKNYDPIGLSRGIPVYGTTDVEFICRGSNTAAAAL